MLRKLGFIGFGLLAACGTETRVNTVPGVCFVLESETDGAPDPAESLWRPCENEAPEADEFCRARLFSDTVLVSITDDRFMGCSECYAPENATGACPGAEAEVVEK